MADTKEQVKVLFVGKERICRQIAYVLDIKDYEHAEKLTAGNFNQYRDHQIYVCEFKKKSGKYVDRKISRTVTNIQYLDDICRAIDEEYYANRERPKNELNPKNVAKRRYEQKQIRKGNPKYLRKYLCGLSLSDLLLYVLKAPINKNIQCTRLETNLIVNGNGNITGCCNGSVMVPFGNLLNGELDEIYNSVYARIVKLSSLNRSYCLCNLDGWCNGYCSNRETPPLMKQFETNTRPKSILLSFDRSCNLSCKMCRNKLYTMSDDLRQRISLMVTKLLRSKYLDQTQKLTAACSGEVFASPYYRQLLTTNLQRQQINIKSNGTLFNQANWRLVAGKYSKINAEISVDAATAETYQKLRGADFNNLMKNLTMLSALRRQNKISRFTLCFVVQRDNFREMADFVRLGRSLGVDNIKFQRINDYGTYTKAEFSDCCLILDNKYLDYELWCILQDPIFKDPIVDLKLLQRYIDASKRRYRKRYEREHRKCFA